ncbi:hypothetical protein P2318_12060 [Myxococcaceae bacterium GXIMD 01537]
MPDHTFPRRQAHRGLRGAVVGAAFTGLLAGCATSAIDDNSLRIARDMLPDTQPPPEGIELGSDAPPLAPPDRDELWAPVYSFPERMGEVGTNSPWYYSGPYPYPLLFPAPTCPPGLGQVAPQNFIQPRPGGSTPGLLP